MIHNKNMKHLLSSYYESGPMVIELFFVNIQMTWYCQLHHSKAEK